MSLKVIHLTSLSVTYEERRVAYLASGIVGLEEKILHINEPARTIIMLAGGHSAVVREPYEEVLRMWEMALSE